MMSVPPLVSAIIPAYNRADYIAAAVASMLAQTLGDLELIVVDDGSTDATAAVVESFVDPRVRLLRHDRRRGIPQARNTGLQAARGRYIAWLDSDDIARPRRLEKQVHFLDDHPAVAMVGSCAGKCGPDGAPLKGVRIPPLRSDDIRAWLLFRSAFQNSSVTGRAETLQRYPYCEEFGVCEDFDLFIRLDRVGPLLNLPEVLIDRRIHPNQTIRLRQDAIWERSVALLAENLDRVGMKFTEEDLHRHRRLDGPQGWKFSPDREFLEWAEAWLNRLRAANAATGRVAADSLKFATGFFWLSACLAARSNLGGARAAGIFCRSGLSLGLCTHNSRQWLREAFAIRRSASARETDGPFRRQQINLP